MQAKNIGPLLIALVLTTLGATAQAAPQTMPRTVIVKTSAPQAAVIVKLGTATLEEYEGGNPAERTTTYLTGETAQKPASLKAAPKLQG